MQGCARRSQVGFIWAQGLGFRGKAACRRSRLERGFDLRIFIERNVLLRRVTHAKGRLCRGAREEGCGGAAQEKK
jgi:hypothetical protein